MDKLNALGSNYSDYQTAVEGAPQFEADTRATVFGQDQGVKDLMGGFSDKVMELYNYDKNKASSYSAPINVQGTNYVANPMIAESATQTGFNQIAREKENAWQLYETRKNLLGSVVDKALKLYEAKLEGKKVGIAAAERDLNTTIDLFKESNRMKEDDRNYALKLAETLNKDKEEDSDVELYANMIESGQGVVTDVPIKIRGKVTDYLSKKGITGRQLLAPADQTAMKFPLEIAAAAKVAESAWKKEFTGLGNYLFGKGATALNKGPEGFTDFQSTIAGARTSINNAISGANLTDYEIKELQDLTPRSTDSDQKVKEKLSALQKWAARKGNATLSAGRYGLKYEDLLDDTIKRGGQGSKPPLSSFDK